MDTLAPEILIHIFAHGSVKEISLWRRVTLVWDRLINDDLVWKTAFFIHWGCNPIKNVDSWKDEYIFRMDQINKMSLKRPKALRICTKQSEIQDISVSTESPLVKVVDLKGLTSALIRSDGRLDNKFILFFDSMFGEAPPSCSKFFTPNCLVLGFEDGSGVFFKRTPRKSLLLEDYSRIRASELTTNPVIDVVSFSSPQPWDDLLFIHQGRFTKNFDFIRWRDLERIESHISALDVLKYLVVFPKIVWIDLNGLVYIKSLSAASSSIQEPKSIAKIQTDGNVLIKNLKDSPFILIASGTNKIYAFNHEKECFVTCFTLPEVKSILSIDEIGNCRNLVQAFALIEMNSGKRCLWRLSIQLDANNLEHESVNEDPFNDFDNQEILALFVNDVFFMVITTEGIFDPSPKYFLKYGNAFGQVRIDRLVDGRFLFMWGRHLAQIWDFNPPELSRRAARLAALKSNEKDVDQGLLGGKALRKLAKYSLNDGLHDWTDERQEEEHLQSLRDRINIDGLNEEELIAYAKLISKDTANIGGDGNSSDASDVDEDLRMALQLSLIEM